MSWFEGWLQVPWKVKIPGWEHNMKEKLGGYTSHASGDGGLGHGLSWGASKNCASKMQWQLSLDMEYLKEGSIPGWVGLRLLVWKKEWQNRAGLGEAGLDTVMGEWSLSFWSHEVWRGDLLLK